MAGENITIKELYKTPIELIKMVCKGYSHALLIEGKGGLGKSHIISDTLGQLGFAMGQDYSLLKGYSTPLALYRFLYFNRDKPLVVLDDVEGILKDRKAKAILKATLEPFQRVVCYETTHKIDVPMSFTMKASVIICSNHYPNDVDFKAVMDRCLFYKFDFNTNEILSILEEICKKPYKNATKKMRNEVLELIKRHKSTISPISIRTLFHILNIYLYSKKNNRKFKGMLYDIYRIDKAKEIIYELSNTKLSVQEQFNRFQKLGKLQKFAHSRATFFRKRQEIASSLGK